MKKILSLVWIVFAFAAGPYAFALKPSKEYKNKPEKYGLKYESLKIKTSDGADLSAWYFPNQQKRSTNLIVVCHNGEGNMADYLDRVSRLLSGDYNVMIFDYRGFGQSSPFEIDEKMYIYPQFTKDFEAITDYCKRTFPCKFYAYGWGMGGGLALGMGFQGRIYKKLIADAPFPSLQDIRKRMKDNAGIEIEVPEIGYDKKYEPLYSLENKTPACEGVLLMVGASDPVITEGEMKEIQSKNKKLVKIHVISNATNADSYDSDKDKYVRSILDFIEK